MLFMTGSTRNVGIGTVTPSYKLDVSGSIRTQTGYIAGANSSADITIDGNTGTLLRYGTQKVLLNSANTILYTADTPRIFIDNGGNVGIGVTNPGAKLEVNGDIQIGTIDGDTKSLVVNGDGSTSATIYLDATNKTYGIYQHGNIKNYFTGNVGIGNSSPGAKLQVDGFTFVNGNQLEIYRSNAGINVSSAHLKLNNNSTQTTIYFTTSDVQKGSIRVDSSGNFVLNSTSSAFYFNNDFGSNALSFINVNTTFMTANGGTVNFPNGNVGIGTASPTNKLQIVGGVTATSFTGSLIGNIYTNSIYKQTTNSPIVINAGSDASKALRVYYDMDVYNGINWTDASWNTQGSIAASSGIMYYYANTRHQFDGDPIALTGDSNYLVSGSGGGYPTFYGNSSSAQIGFARSGNSEGLSYLGADATFLFRLWDSSFGQGYFNVLRSNGNVGINVTTPGYRLHVDGTGYFTDTVTANSNLGVNGRYTINGSTTFGYKIAYNGLNLGNGTVVSDSNAADGYTIYMASANGSTMFYGPYTSISNGEYVASFRMKVSDNSSTSALGQIDVIGTNTTGSTVIITPSMFETSNRYQYVDIPFTANGSNSGIEFRGVSFSSGITNTYLDHVIIRPLSKNYIQFQPENKNYDIFYHGVGTPRFRIKSDGNVGIGTASPTQKLQVNGSAILNGSLFLENSLTRISSDASGEVGINYGSSNTSTYSLSIYDSTTRAAGITKTGGGYFAGNVGIGTTSPAVLLHIYGSGNTFTRYTNTTSTGHYIDIGANSAGESFVYGYGAYPLLFGTNGTERMRILSGGNVGIGITNPAYKLDVVAGDVRIMNVSGPTLNFSDNVDQNWDMGVDASLNSFYVKNGISGVRHLTITTGGNVGMGTTSPIAKLHVTGSADVMLVEGSGSTSNTSLFAIDGNNGRLFEVSDDLSDSLFSVNTIAGLPVIEAFADNTVILGAYNKSDLVVTGSSVGIGTPSPTRALDVYNSGSQIVAQFSSSNATSTRIKFSDANTGAENVNIGAIGTRMAMWTNNAERISILSGGSVGIGTTSPVRDLQVGNLTSTSTATPITLSLGGTYSSTAGSNVKLRVYEESGGAIGGMSVSSGQMEVNTWSSGKIAFYRGTTQTMIIGSDGNVGINQSSPAAKLHVNGTLRVDNAGSAPAVNTPFDAGSVEGYYGGTQTNILGRPDEWLAVNVSGVNYVIPLYTPA